MHPLFILSGHSYMFISFISLPDFPQIVGYLPSIEMIMASIIVLLLTTFIGLYHYKGKSSHTISVIKTLFLIYFIEEWTPRYVLRDILQEKLDLQVSPSHLCEVAKRLGPNWQLLAPHLHITPEQVEEIIDDYPSDLQDQIQVQIQGLKCLQKWSRDQNSKATYRVLTNAICKIRSTDLIDCMHTLLGSNFSPSYADSIQYYGDILRLSYLRLRPPFIFEGDDSGPSPSEQYINLVMTTRERVQRGQVDEEHISQLALHGDTQGMADYMRKRGQKVPVDVKDIFTINNTQNKLILIEGAPGSGKTTLSRHIVKTWAMGELFQQFSLVLLIQLRDRVIPEAQGLADLLPFEFNLEERKAIIKDMKQRNGEGVLLLFDGWDELPEEKKSIFLAILKHPGKYRLSKATVLITSRPIASTVIQDIHTTRIEILDFTPEQIDNYIRESLHKKEEEANKLISTIREDPILEENCYLPLSLVIITHTYITLNHKLPATFCRIIIELALSCLYRHIKKHTPYGYLYVTLNSFDDLQESMKKDFDSLCKIAYDSILKQRYSFNNPNMPTLGLMQSVQSFAVRGKSTEHYFLHLSLHELCAAWHLVTLSPSEQERILHDYFQMDNIFGFSALGGLKLQIENVLGFFSALGGWKSQKNKKLLFHHTIDLETIKDCSNIVVAVYAEPRSLTHLQYFHEAQSPELCESLHSMIHIDFSDTSEHTSRDIAAVRYIISTKKLESLALSFISDEHLKELKPTLRKNMPEHLCIGNGRHLGHEGWKIIADLMEQTAMKAFSCCVGEITSLDIDCLGTALQHSQLYSFGMSLINIGDTGLVRFAKYVENTGLTHLCLEGCEIGDEGIASLSTVLPDTKLNTLSIGGNNISSRGLTVLANAIMNTPTFRVITFDISKANKVTPGRDVQEFLERLLHHPQFYKIIINVRTIDETFREYFIGFTRRRFELGLQMVNMGINDSVVSDDADKSYWLIHSFEFK